MKWFFISLCSTLFTAQFAWAQKVGVQVDNVEAAENTTIEIKKGSAVTTPGTSAKFQIVEGEDTIEGEGALLVKEAKKNFTKACDAWKKEIRDLNKNNEVIKTNCGSQSCATQSGETVCTAKGTYKIKVKMD